MNRIPQIVLISTFLSTCWLAMQVFHEVGHVIGALLTGADIQRVYLHPLTFSRTDLLTNPHPLIVVWMGPIIGVGLPLTLFLIAKIAKAPKLYLYRFFSGFCLIFNGVYIAFGPKQGPLDSGVMLTHGASRLFLAGYGLITILPGFFLWHSQGNCFGLGKSKGKVDKNAARVSACLLIIIILSEVLYSSY